MGGKKMMARGGEGVRDGKVEGREGRRRDGGREAKWGIEFELEEQRGGQRDQGRPEDVLSPQKVAYYSSNLPKLQNLKCQLDPHNYFNYDQSISCQSLIDNPQ
jgi:hypothetical protein